MMKNFIQSTSSMYTGISFAPPLESCISIKYTGLPFVFFTASHCSEIDVKLLFVTVRFLGVGGKEPSPVIRDDKVFTLVKNSQLS